MSRSLSNYDGSNPWRDQEDREWHAFFSSLQEKPIVFSGSAKQKTWKNDVESTLKNNVESLKEKKQPDESLKYDVESLKATKQPDQTTVQRCPDPCGSVLVNGSCRHGDNCFNQRKRN